MVEHRMLCFFHPTNTKKRKFPSAFFVSSQFVSGRMYKVRCSLPTPFVSIFPRIPVIHLTAWLQFSVVSPDVRSCQRLHSCCPRLVYPEA